MAIPKSQLRECLSAAGALLQKRRPPAEVRDQVDFRVNINGSEVMIVEIRPTYQDPKHIISRPIAKAKWVETKETWRLFWMRADSKWHAYESVIELKSISDVIDEVDRDAQGCFFG